MAKGIVKWFNDRKGFGFIEGNGEGKDIFVHYSKIEGEGFKTLTKGQEVDYDYTDGPKGPLATKVIKV
jgi:CspA family cold shock protein